MVYPVRVNCVDFAQDTGFGVQSLFSTKYVQFCFFGIFVRMSRFFYVVLEMEATLILDENR